MGPNRGSGRGHLVILLGVRGTSAWPLVPAWALALVAVVLGSVADGGTRELALPVTAAFLLGCAARVLAPGRRLASLSLLGGCLSGVLAVAQSLTTVPGAELWWLAAVLPCLVCVALEDSGSLRLASTGLAILAAALGWPADAGTGQALVASVLGVCALALVPTRGLGVLRRRGVLVAEGDLRLAAWAQASVAASGVALAVLQLAPQGSGDGPQAVQAWASAAFALVLVMVFTPMVTLNTRVGVQGGVDPAATIIAVATELGAAPAGGPDALDRICAALRTAWGVAEVAIVRDGSAPPRESAAGRSVVTVPLLSDGRSVGWLVVRALPGLDIAPVVPHVERITSLLAASLVLHDLTSGAEQLRRRVTGARDAERRVLTRELGTHLAPGVRGVADGLRAAARSLEQDPLVALDLDDATAELSRSTADVRRIARALLPGALDQGDLDGAFRELLRQPGLSPGWSLRAEGADALDPATKQTLYLVLADLLDELRATPVETGLDTGLDVVLAIDEVTARLRVGVPGQELSSRTRRRLREAIERHAAHLALAVRDLAHGEGVEVVVYR